MSLILNAFQGNTPQAKAIARNLNDKLGALKQKIQDALVSQVAEDFIDISTPLKQLSEAAIVPVGKLTFYLIFPNRFFLILIG